MGTEVSLIDSGIASAEVVKGKLKELSIENKSNIQGNSEFYVSDIPTTFVSVAELFLGKQITGVHKADIESFPNN